MELRELAPERQNVDIKKNQLQRENVQIRKNEARVVTKQQTQPQVRQEVKRLDFKAVNV